jgi:hypothetical protein
MGNIFTTGSLIAQVIGANNVLGCLMQSQKFIYNLILDFFWRFLNTSNKGTVSSSL